MAKKRIHFTRKKKTPSPLWLLASLIALPVLIWAFYTQLYPYIKATTSQTPKYVRINPAQIRIPLSSKPINLSALAYDTNNQPIYTGVTYSWGMSSTTSVGTIQSHNDLATFFPQNAGNGNLFVQAVNINGQAMGSISITICSGTTCPPITPTTTPLPTPTPTATPTPQPPTRRVCSKTVKCLNGVSQISLNGKCICPPEKPTQ